MLSDRQKYAATLALMIERLLESVDAGEPQKVALRALWQQAELSSATIRMYDDVLTVDGEAMPDTPYMRFLADRLRAHGVVELVIARHAESTELLALSRGLACNTGQGRIKERLRDVSSSKIMIIIEQRDDFAGRQRSAGVTAAFQRIRDDEAAKSEWNKFLDNAAKKAEEKSIDLGMAGVAPAAAPIPPPPPAPAPPGMPAPEPRPQLAQPATLQASSPLGIALAKLLSSPYAPDTLTKLTMLSRQLEDALRQDKVAEVIDALNTLIELETKAPSEQLRGSYHVTLKRLLNGATLAQIAPYLLEAKRARRAAAALTRGGEAGVNLLVGLLAAAATLGERLIYMDVLKTLPGGVDRVVGLLSRPELLVVCNAAEVAGEARLEAAVPYLARHLEHADARVRRAALIALAKIGTAPTVEPLRAALKDAAPELRAALARSIGGAQARPLTAPLLAAIESENQAELQREYCRALGRIGTNEAAQALARVAEPGGRLLGRKPLALRLAAVEGLRLANAAAALQVLSNDGDKAVRELAQQALAGSQAS